MFRLLGWVGFWFDANDEKTPNQRRSFLLLPAAAAAAFPPVQRRLPQSCAREQSRPSASSRVVSIRGRTHIIYRTHNIFWKRKTLFNGSLFWPSTHQIQFDNFWFYPPFELFNSFFFIHFLVSEPSGRPPFLVKPKEEKGKKVTRLIYFYFQKIFRVPIVRLSMFPPVVLII